MAPPELFINTKTWELEKQPVNEKGDGYEDFEPEKKQKQDAEKEDKGDDSSDPAEDTNEKDKNRKTRSFPILTYIVSLVFTGVAFALVGVSFKECLIRLRSQNIFNAGLSLVQRACLPIFPCSQSSPHFHWMPPLCQSSWEQV